MRVIELHWRCVECETHNLGRYTTCRTCGAPRETGETLPLGTEVDGSNAPTVTDSNLLKIAQGKPDWFCAHCVSSNRDSSSTCSSCGAPRHEGERDHETATESTIRPDITEETEEVEPSIFDPEPQATPPASKAPAVGVGCATILALVFGAWAFSTTTYVGEIQASSWKQTIQVERWTDTTVSEWGHRVTPRLTTNPVNGVGEQAGMTLLTCQKKHYDDEKYVCGSHQECHDVMKDVRKTSTCMESQKYACGETCKSNGNGFASCHTKYCSKMQATTCTKTEKVFDHKECNSVNDYCSRPIYKDWCNYATQKWAVIDTQVSQGSEFKTTWPVVNLGVLDRAQRSGSYEVSFKYDRGETKAMPKTELEYRAWEGHNATITRTNIGLVTSVEPL